jgi:hypothetical protein
VPPIEDADVAPFPPDHFTDDGGPPEPAARDATPDAPLADALPPIEVMPPGPAVNDCPDAAATLVYVITMGNMLMSFYPPAAAFTPIGKINCPVASPNALPFSMAVDRSGAAYVVFFDGELFRVSTATARCEATGFNAGSTFTSPFGMAYAKDSADGGETLYVAEAETVPGPCRNPARLAWIDTSTLALHVIGGVIPAICRPELTGTGGGDLFAFYENPPSTGAAIGLIDKTAARLTAQSVLTGVHEGTAWAFAFWGGDFYTFTAPGADTVVTRFRPSDGSIVKVGQLAADRVVGAGVSTCAPQQ